MHECIVIDHTVRHPCQDREGAIRDTRKDGPGHGRRSWTTRSGILNAKHESQVRSVVPAGRPRDSDLDKRIYVAVIEELAASGFAAFTIKSVARRSNTTRSAVYRRWPSKAELIRSVFSSYMELEEVRSPESAGSLRADLLVRARLLASRMTPTAARAIMSVLLIDDDDDGYFSQVRTKMIQIETAATSAILDRAFESGEISWSVSAGEIAVILPSLLFTLVLVHRKAATESILLSYVDGIVLPSIHGRFSEITPAEDRD